MRPNSRLAKGKLVIFIVKSDNEHFDIYLMTNDTQKKVGYPTSELRYFELKKKWGTPLFFGGFSATKTHF